MFVIQPFARASLCQVMTTKDRFRSAFSADCTLRHGKVAPTLPRPAVMRSIRRFSQLVLTLGGGALVLFAVYRVDVLYDRVLIAALGILIMELGIWQVTRAFFPNQRAYRPLRQETDYFLKLVRRLNRTAIAAQRGDSNAEAELDRLEAEMIHSIQRMRRLAGRTETEVGLAIRSEAQAVN